MLGSNFFNEALVSLNNVDAVVGDIDDVTTTTAFDVGAATADTVEDVTVDTGVGNTVAVVCNTVVDEGVIDDAAVYVAVVSDTIGVAAVGETIVEVVDAVDDAGWKKRLFIFPTVHSVLRKATKN